MGLVAQCTWALKKIAQVVRADLLFFFKKYFLSYPFFLKKIIDDVLSIFCRIQQLEVV